jgi:hypothetical protein
MLTEDLRLEWMDKYRPVPVPRNLRGEEVEIDEMKGRLRVSG